MDQKLLIVFLLDILYMVLLIDSWLLIQKCPKFLMIPLWNLEMSFSLKMFFLWKINCLNLFVILLVLIYHLVVMLIRTLFFNLGVVKDLKKLRILVLNFAFFYLEMILKLMMRSWGLLMHLFGKKLLMIKWVLLKLIKLGFLLIFPLVVKV